MTAFGDLLRKRLDEREITLRAFAKIVGNNPGFISQVIHGDRTPPAKKWDLWAKSLGITSKSDIQRFRDLAAIAHIPKEAQPRFVSILDRLEAAEETLDAL